MFPAVMFTACRKSLDLLRNSALVLCPLLVLLAPVQLGAAVVELLDGTRISGAVLEKGEGWISILDAAGTRHRLSYEQILGANFEEGSTPELEKRAAKERQKIAEEREADLRKLLSNTAKSAAGSTERQQGIAALGRYDESVLLPALAAAVRSPRREQRELALELMDTLGSPQAVAAMAVGSLLVKDEEHAHRAKDLAVAKNADLAQRVYEFAASRPKVVPHARIHAIDYLGDMGRRDSVPVLLRAAHVAAIDIRLTMVQNAGIRTVPVNLGSLNQAASQVDIELPHAELIEVHTSAIVPVAILESVTGAAYSSLRKITGQTLGDDLAAWQEWWDKEEKKAPVAPKSAQGEKR